MLNPYSQESRPAQCGNKILNRANSSANFHIPPRLLTKKLFNYDKITFSRVTKKLKAGSA